MSSTFGYATAEVEPEFVSEASTDTVPLLVSVDGISEFEAHVKELNEEVIRLRRQLEMASRQVWIATLDDPSLALRFPLPVQLEQSADGQFVASSLDFELFGSGESETDAMDDLRRVILEELEFLTESERVLGPHPASKLRRLREMIARRP